MLRITFTPTSYKSGKLTGTMHFANGDHVQSCHCEIEKGRSGFSVISDGDGLPTWLQSGQVNQLATELLCTYWNAKQGKDAYIWVLA